MITNESTEEIKEIIFPGNAKRMLRFFEGEEVKVFTEVMRQLTPLAKRFVLWHRRRMSPQLEGYLDEDGCLRMRVPLAEFTNYSSHYGRVKQTLLDIQYAETGAGKLFSGLSFTRQNRVALVEIAMSRDVLLTLLDVKRGYTPVPYAVPNGMKEPWHFKLYLELVSWVGCGSHTEKLSTIGEHLFPRMHDALADSRLLSRIAQGIEGIHSCFEELPAEQGFSITHVVETRFARDKNVCFFFNGFEGAGNGALTKDLERKVEGICDSMAKKFGLNKTQIQRVKYRLNESNIDAVCNYAEGLASRLKTSRVINKRAYAYVSLMKCISDCGKTPGKNAKEKGLKEQENPSLPKMKTGYQKKQISINADKTATKMRGHATKAKIKSTLKPLITTNAAETYDASGSLPTG